MRTPQSNRRVGVSMLGLLVIVLTAGRVLPLPPRATVTLPADGVSTGAIRLRDLPTVNQDECKGKAFSLTWSGTAEQ